MLLYILNDFFGIDGEYKERLFGEYFLPGDNLKERFCET
jgi:hypothetical protein